MVWLALALLLYCGMCWLAASFLIGVPRAVGQADMQRSLARARLALIVLAPLYMPLVVFRVPSCLVRSYQARRWVRTLRRIQRTVREYEFRPVKPWSLDRPVRGRLDALTPPLVELGFQPLGDFRMKPQPVVVHGRYFLSADGRTVAGICSILEAGVVSFISVLEDGTCVHTSGTRNPHPERALEPTDRLALSYLPGRHPTNLYREHLEAVRGAAERSGSRVLELRPNQFRAVMVYDQRLFNRWRYRHGGLDREPPAPNFRTLVAG
jgi:hypothetical protein